MSNPKVTFNPRINLGFYGSQKLFTFGMIKPDAMNDGNGTFGKILSYIESRAITIIHGETQTLSESRAREFYQEHEGKPFFDGLVSHMTSGPVFPMILKMHELGLQTFKKDAIQYFRELMGATNPAQATGLSIRGIWGRELPRNVIHGSDSLEAAIRESEFFFGGKNGR